MRLGAGCSLPSRCGGCRGRSAESLYRQCRGTILVQGAILALAAYIPMLNLLIPVVGTAAMVHVLDMATNRRSHASLTMLIRYRMDINNLNRMLFRGRTPW